MDPNVVGQSGTDNPASLLVTSAPATINSNVTHAVNTAKRCSPRWYGVAIAFRTNSLAPGNHEPNGSDSSTPRKRPRTADGQGGAPSGTQHSSRPEARMRQL